MKLWFKVFLIAVLSVSIGIFTTATAVLAGYFGTSIRSLKDKAVSDHTYCCSYLYNAAAFRRAEQGVLLLPPDETEHVMRETLDAMRMDGLTAGIYADSTLKAGKELAVFTGEDFRKAAETTDRCVVTIADEGERVAAAVASRIEIEGETYLLFTAEDITDTYTIYERQLLTVRLLSIGFACAVALLLLLTVRRLLRPLDDVNGALKQIAAGDYTVRLRPTKNDSIEFRQMANNVNAMAQAVSETVEKLEGIADSRKQFTDNLAHEMKTPLTSIMGLADILRLKKEVPDSERQEYADIIVQEARRLRALSSKLLELASAGSGQLERHPVRVTELFEEIDAAIMPLFRRAGLTLTVETEDCVIDVDRVLFVSMLYNLLDNAVKASHEGQTVLLKCRKKEGRAVLSVTDFGVGISREDIKKVTEPFYMADKSRSRKAGGAGLGLALCVEIARVHRAVFSIKSKLGVGTTVSISLALSEDTI